MKKSFIIAFFFGLTLSSHGQGSLTDEQVTQRAIDMNNRGMSQKEIYLALKKEGVSDAQMKRIYTNRTNAGQASSVATTAQSSSALFSRLSTKSVRCLIKFNKWHKKK